MLSKEHPWNKLSNEDQVFMLVKDDWSEERYGGDCYYAEYSSGSGDDYSYGSSYYYDECEDYESYSEWYSAWGDDWWYSQSYWWDSEGNWGYYEGGDDWWYYED